jgi:hypothetical protein
VPVQILSQPLAGLWENGTLVEHTGGARVLSMLQRILGKGLGTSKPELPHD